LYVYFILQDQQKSTSGKYERGIVNYCVKIYNFQLVKSLVGPIGERVNEKFFSEIFAPAQLV